MDQLMTNFKSALDGNGGIEGIAIIIENVAIDQTFDDLESADDIELVKGHKMSKNPWKLILGTQQFIANLSVPSKKGQRWYY